MLTTVEVANPHGLTVPDVRVVRGEVRYDEPKVVAVRSLRGDPLARMHDQGPACGRIDVAQYRAGRVMQSHIEAREVGRIKSTLPANDKVDISHNGSIGLTDRQQGAFRELMRIQAALGRNAYRRLYMFLGDGKFAKDIAAESGVSARSVSGEIRAGLTALAKYLGFA